MVLPHLSCPAHLWKWHYGFGVLPDPTLLQDGQALDMARSVFACLSLWSSCTSSKKGSLGRGYSCFNQGWIISTNNTFWKVFRNFSYASQSFNKRFSQENQELLGKTKTKQWPMPTGKFLSFPPAESSGSSWLWPCRKCSTWAFLMMMSLLLLVGALPALCLIMSPINCTPYGPAHLFCLPSGAQFGGHH